MPARRSLTNARTDSSTASADEPRGGPQQLTFESLVGRYQPKNQPTPKHDPLPNANASPAMPASTNLFTMDITGQDVGAAGAGGPTPQQQQQQPQQPHSLTKAFGPGDMGPLRPTGKRQSGLGLPSGSHIKRRPLSVPRRMPNAARDTGAHGGGAAAAGGHAVGDAGTGHGNEAGGAAEGHGAVNAYGSPSTTALHYTNYRSPALLSLGGTNSSDTLAQAAGSLTALNGTGTAAAGNGDAGAAATAAAAGGPGRANAATRPGRESRLLTGFRRADPSPAPSRPQRANRRRQPQQPQQPQQSKQAAVNAVASPNTPVNESLHLGTAVHKSGSAALSGRSGVAGSRALRRQHSDSVMLADSPNRDDRDSTGRGKTLVTSKRPPSGRMHERAGSSGRGGSAKGTGANGVSASTSLLSGAELTSAGVQREREEAVASYLALCSELGEQPNSDWVTALTRSGPGGGSGAGSESGGASPTTGSGPANSPADKNSPLSTPHVGQAGTSGRSGRTGGGSGGNRPLSGRRPRMSAAGSTTPKNDSGTMGSGLATNSAAAGTGGGSGIGVSTTISPGHRRLKVTTPAGSTGGAPIKRSSSVGRVNTVNRPNISFATQSSLTGSLSPVVHGKTSSGGTTPSGAARTGSAADVFMDRMTAYCEHRLRPYHEKMAALRQSRQDVRASLEHFLTQCHRLEECDAVVAAAAEQSPLAHSRYRGVTSSNNTSSTDAISSAVAAHANANELKRAAESLTDGLYDVQHTVAQLLLKLGECAKDARKPIGGCFLRPIGASSHDPNINQSPSGTSATTQALDGHSISAASRSPAQMAAEPQWFLPTSDTHTDGAAAAAAVVGEVDNGQSMPAIPPLGIKDIVLKRGAAGGVESGNVYANSSIPQSPCSGTGTEAPSGFVDFLARQEREITVQLNGLRDTVKNALEKTPWVCVTDEEMLQTPLFLPSGLEQPPAAAFEAAERQMSNTYQRGSPAMPTAAGRRSARAGGTPRQGGAAGGVRTPRTGGGALALTPRGGGSNAMTLPSRTPRSAAAGGIVTPRSSKAAKSSDASSAAARRRSSGLDELLSSKRDSLGGGGAVPVSSHLHACSPVFVVADARNASFLPHDSNEENCGVPVNTAAFAPAHPPKVTLRPLLLLGGGGSPVVQASVPSASLEAGADSNADAAARAASNSTDNTPNAIDAAAAAPGAAKDAKDGKRSKAEGKANAARTRSLSAGAGKKAGKASKNATGNSSLSSTVSSLTGKKNSTGAAVGPALTATAKKNKDKEKDKEKDKCEPAVAASAASEPVAGTDMVVHALLERARSIWEAVSTHVRATAGQSSLHVAPLSAPESASDQSLPFSLPTTAAPAESSVAAANGSTTSLPGDASGMHDAVSAEQGPQTSVSTVETATRTPPPMVISATNVFSANDEQGNESAEDGHRTPARADDNVSSIVHAPAYVLSPPTPGGMPDAATAERGANAAEKPSADTTLLNDASGSPHSSAADAASSPSPKEAATEPVKQERNRRDAHSARQSSASSVPAISDSAAAGTPGDASRKLQLDDDAAKDGERADSSPGSSSFASARTATPQVNSCDPQAWAASPNETHSASRAAAAAAATAAATTRATARAPTSVLSDVDAASRIARFWRSVRLTRHARTDKHAAMQARAAQCRQQLQKARVRCFLLWAVRRQRLRTALQIMRVRAYNEANARLKATERAPSPVGGDTKGAAGGKRGGGSSSAGSSKVSSPTTTIQGGKRSPAAAGESEEGRRLRRRDAFLLLLVNGCSAADIPERIEGAAVEDMGSLSSMTSERSPTSPAAGSARKKSVAVASRDRFQQAREQRKSMKVGSPVRGASASPTSNHSGSGSPNTAAAPPSSLALPLLAKGITTKAILSYNSDAENFEVSVLHRLLRAPQPLLYALRVAADRYPSIPPMGYARPKEQPPDDAAEHKNNDRRAATATTSQSPDRGTSASEPRADAGAAEAESHRAAVAERRRQKEAEVGVYVVPFARLRPYAFYCAEPNQRRSAATTSASVEQSQAPEQPSEVSFGSNMAGSPTCDDASLISSTSASPLRAGASTSSPLPFARRTAAEHAIPFSVRYSSYIEADELSCDTPVTKPFTRPFERWSMAYSFSRRIFTAAAIYAWKLLFSHTPHDDFKQRQLQTEEDQQARLSRVHQRNRMILACYCVHSEREWLREASKDLSFVGQIYNPKKSMDPNDPDLDKHCRETYNFVEDFLYQCFPTANTLDDVPPFLVGAGIYFVLKEVFHVSGSDDAWSTLTEATQFTRRYPELVVSAVDARLEDENSNEIDLNKWKAHNNNNNNNSSSGSSSRRHHRHHREDRCASQANNSSSSQCGPASRLTGRGGGRLTNYQQHTVQSYELIDLIDRLSGWHYAAAGRGGGAKGASGASTGANATTGDKRASLRSVAVVPTTVPASQGQATTTGIASNSTSAITIATAAAAHRRSSSAFDPFFHADSVVTDEDGFSSTSVKATSTVGRAENLTDGLGATWISASAGVTHNAMSLATPTMPLALSQELQSRFSPLSHTGGGRGSSGHNSTSSLASAASANSAGPSDQPPSQQQSSAADNAKTNEEPADTMAEVVASHVKLVKVPETALFTHSPAYNRTEFLKQRESAVLASLAALAQAQTKTFDFSCRELAVLYPKGFLVSLSQKLAYELLGLRLTLDVCEDLDSVE